MQFSSLRFTRSILGAASIGLFGSARVELTKNWGNTEIKMIQLPKSDLFLSTFLLQSSVCAKLHPPSQGRWTEPGKRIRKVLSVDTGLIHSRRKKRAISYMRTEPIKCLSSVSKANMGGIRNFPSAVITPITLPIADSTVICLVQSCFGLLPGLIGFVYADCSFAEPLSFFFPSCFLFSLGPAQSPE